MGATTNAMAHRVRGSSGPTTPDLVVLSLLCERPMHGYELNRELEYREVGDWAGISRAQVYYSIKKALALGWLELSSSGSASAGPERQEVQTTALGRTVLTEALQRPTWATQRTAPPFLTWLALSHHLARETLGTMFDRRRDVLKAELARETRTLDAIHTDTGTMVVAAKLMVDLTVRQIRLELTWLDDVKAKLLQE